MDHGSRLLRDFGALFDSGSTGGLSDAQLLERFEARRGEAEAAFEGLVSRHAPMVLGIARRVLRDPNDVDDAFQATFLILATRARSIRDRGSLGGWLARVALRVALRAGEQGRRRREFERRAAREEGVIASEVDDLRSAVDEEVDRLPERFRRPVVLCYLEGLTHEEAALRLHCPVGTIRSRLSRARDRLQGRLARRGLGPADLATLAPLLPPPLALRAAARVAVQPSTASAAATLLEKGFAMTLLWSRWKRAGLWLLACGSTAGVVALAGPTREAGHPEPTHLAGVTATAKADDPPPPRPQQDEEVQPRRDDAQTVAFAPDGKTLAAGYDDGTLQIFDAATGASLATFQGPKGYVRSIAFAPDGETLAAAFDGKDGNLVKLWEPHSGRLKRELPGFQDPSVTIVSLAFAPHGKTLAIAGSGLRWKEDDPSMRSISEIRVYDLESELTDWNHLGRGDFTTKIAFAPDGKTLASATSRSIKLWDSRTGDLKRTLKTDRAQNLYSLAFAPDGSMLAGGGATHEGGAMVGRVVLWDLRTGEVIRTLEAPRGTSSAEGELLAFAPDGRSVAFGGFSTVKQGMITVPGVARPIMGGKVVSEVRLWDVATGEQRWISEGELGPARSLAFAPDGKSLVRGDEADVAQIDSKTGQVLRKLMKTAVGKP